VRPDRKVKQGDRVEVNFRVGLQDAGPVTLADGQESLTAQFCAGGDEVLKPLSDSIIGMSAGERKEVVVPPEASYGTRKEGLVMEVPRAELPPDAKEGDQLKDEATQKRWRVTELKHETAVLDANHPLAGRTLILDVELAAIL
jgi:peptidylprolyl isomerase